VELPKTQDTLGLIENQSEIFEKLEEKIKANCDKPTQEKALKRIELLKKYLNSHKIDIPKLLKNNKTKNLVKNRRRSTIYNNLSKNSQISTTSEEVLKYIKLYL